MTTTLLGLLGTANPGEATGDLAMGVLSMIIWTLLFVVPLGLAAYAVYYSLSQPLRRQEQARFFLDLLETGLRQGRSPEHTLIAIAQTREKSVGVRFHLLAAYLEQGQRLAEALDQVPRLLPPQLTAMLKTGLKLGNLEKVLPACRRLLADGNSQVQSAVNYMLVIGIAVTPLIPLVGGFLMVMVFPKFVQIYQDMAVVPPPLISWIVRFGGLEFWGVILLPMLIIALVLYYSAFVFIAGPQASARVHRWIGPAADRLILWLPWRRHRLHRDFSAMLAVLLDASVPESEAVILAAQCTTNTILQRKAKRVVEGLRQGERLTEAMAHFDETGEFRWRLTNAVHAKSGFLRALTGWHEALDARAFKLEQAAAQGVTTGLVLLNGLMVGAISVAVYQCLIAIINTGVTW